MDPFFQTPGTKVTSTGPKLGHIMKKDSPTPTLKGWLAHLDDTQLAQILRNRPDTALPLPPGLGSLTARLQLRASIQRAIHKLTALELAVLEAAANAGAELNPITAPEVVERLDQSLRDVPGKPTREQVDQALIRLRQMAIIFGDEAFMIVAEAMSTLPTNWQLLPEEQGVTVTYGEASQSIAALPERHRKILVTLVTSGGRGLTRDAALTADPTRPIPQLIKAGLLARVDEQTVKLPAVVRRVLEGREAVAWRILPIAPNAQPADDDAGIAAGLEVVRQQRMLIDALSASPAVTLKEGALGVRVMSRLTKELQLDEEAIARLVGLGVSAGLLRRGVPDPLPAGDDGENYLAPTEAADEWLQSSLAEQLAVLLRGWWTQTHAVWLLGQADEKDKPIHLLSAASIHQALPDTRRLIITSLSRVVLENLNDDLFFHHPIAASRISQATIDHLLAEAQWIGAVAGGSAGDGITSATRVLVESGSVAELADISAAIKAPTPVDHFIVQADFTIMVPGPLEPTMQKVMEQIAVLESPGLASMYRLSEASFRHGMDLGMTATEIEDFLTQHSATEVPQSVIYLLQDIARRHGTLRGGPAMSYLRSDDPALLHSAVEAATELDLRQIAPTVAVSQASLFQVISLLRTAGFQPVAEDALGASLNLIRSPARVPSAAQPVPKPQLEDNRIQAAVSAIRREEAAQKGTTSEQPTLAVLQAAARGNRTVTLGFVDKQGVAVHRVVKPLTVTAGQVDAIDETTGAVHRFMLHRITEVIVD